jgi:hypothetical protein
MSLEFLHPHMETVINDNSEYFETTSGGSTTLFQPFFSNRGPDNRMLRFTNYADFVKTHGLPNLKKYGQSEYNILNWLTSGGNVYSIRLMPTDATYSNVTLDVRTKHTKYVKGGTITQTNVTKSYTVNVTANEAEGSKYTYDNIISSIVNNTQPESNDKYTVTIVSTDETPLTTTAQITWKIGENTIDPSAEIDEGNYTFVASWTVDSEPSTTQVPSFEVQVVTTSSKNATDVNKILDNKANIVANANTGWESHPILTIYPKGRGQYGNDYSIKINPLTTLDATYDFRMYAVSILNGATTELGGLQCSFFPEAISLGNSSLNIESLANVYAESLVFAEDEESYTELSVEIANAFSDIKDYYTDKMEEVTGEDEASNTLRSTYQAYIDRATKIISSPNSFDFILGMDKETKKMYSYMNGDTNLVKVSTTQSVEEIGDNYSYVTVQENDTKITDVKIAYPSTEGIYLNAGSDGDWNSNITKKSLGLSDDDLSNTKYGEKWAKEQVLVNAYQGGVDKNVTNKKMYEFDILLDANYPTSVKEAMASLSMERYDCLALLDTQGANSAAGAIENRNLCKIDYYGAAFFAHLFKVYDSINVMDIEVTSTYFLASRIPQHDRENGIHMPFVGPTRGIITGFKSVNFIPNVQEKEDMYIARVNYLEQDLRSTKWFANNTSQFKSSALTAINNVRVMFKVIRDVEKAMGNYYFEYPSPSILTSMNQQISDICSPWVANGACSSLSGNAYQTAYDKELKVIRVKIDCTFNSVIERILIEFNVNRATA